MQGGRWCFLVQMSTDSRVVAWSRSSRRTDEDEDEDPSRTDCFYRWQSANSGCQADNRAVRLASFTPPEVVKPVPSAILLYNCKGQSLEKPNSMSGKFVRLGS